MQLRFWKHNISRQCKAKWKGNWEGDNKRCDRGRNGEPANVLILLVQNVLESNMIKKDAQYRIRAATSQVPERLLIYKPFERLMEKVDDREDDMSDCLEH